MALRKHFETYSRTEINKGRLIRSGIDFRVRYMNHADIPLNLALQRHVMSVLKSLGKEHYIIPKDELFLQRHLNQGNAIIGTFVKDKGWKKPDRLAAHMFVVYPNNEKECNLSDTTILPDKDVSNISIVSNILVHQDFRGNRLMQQMLGQWLHIAEKDGKKHAVAEISVDNEFSWSVFLDCGFVIYAAAHDSRDNSDVVYVHKPLDRQFQYSTDPKDVTVLKLFDEQGHLDAQKHDQLKDLLDEGYHVLRYDRRTRLLFMAKCVGTVPLPSVQDRPPPPANY